MYRFIFVCKDKKLVRMGIFNLGKSPKIIADFYRSTSNTHYLFNTHEFELASDSLDPVISRGSDGKGQWVARSAQTSLNSLKREV